MNWTLATKRTHRKREVTVVPPIDVRRARQGTVHPKEWRCGLRCGLLFRYAHRHEIPSTQCHEKGAHEFIVCPAHKEFPICLIHSRGFSDSNA